MASAARNGLKQWLWNLHSFRKYGLKYHDVFYETPEVQEALRRLPQKIVDERNFRIIRAIQCSIEKKYLPQGEWMTFDQDDYYLKPYLEEVQRENKEKEEWRKK